MRRKYDAIGDGVVQSSKENRTMSASVKQRKAVPPGYLHDLLHSKQLMKSVGLRAPIAPKTGNNKNMSTAAAITSGRLAQLAKPQTKPSKVHPNTLPSILELRKKFLQTQRKRRRREETPYQQHPEKPVGLLSLPEDVLLKIVCKLHHDDIKPLFTVCKQLTNTLRDAIKFHFNYATPSRMITDEPTPTVKRPDRKRAVTALSDVLGHLRRHQRHVAAPARLGGVGSSSNAPGSTQSTRPRMLNFTPQATPLSHRNLFSIDYGGSGVGGASSSGQNGGGGTIVFHDE